MMKKNFVILAFCTLISIGGSQTSSFASDSIPEDVIAFAKPKCQGVFPELKEKLDSWVEHQKIVSKISSLFHAAQYKEILQALEHTEQMDVLYPDILSLGKTLMDTLADLQAKYPYLGKQVGALMGVEKELDEIAENFSRFVIYNQYQQNKKNGM